MENFFIGVLYLLINFTLILLVYRYFGKVGLFIWIAISTIIANIQVVKPIEIFTISATLGNITYASIFLASDIIAEKYGKKNAQQAVIIGFLANIVLFIASQFTLLYTPADYGKDIDDALNLIFSFIPRVLLGSFIAYFISNLLDINIFIKIKNKFPSQKYLWLRNNLSTLTSEFIDTAIFVSIAFLGAEGFTNAVVFEIFLTTYFLKALIGLADTPFFYIAIKKIKPKEISQ